MGILSGLEDNLEKYIEGFFKDRSGGAVQPVEIAKKIAKSMRDARLVSVNAIYIPNLYTVKLNPIDFEGMASFTDKLARELEGFVEKKAKEKKFTLTGRPVVEITADQSVPSGDIVIEALFSKEAAHWEGEASKGECTLCEHTQPFTPVKSPPGIKTSNFNGFLRVESGPDRGKIIALAKPVMFVGRRESCDIVFNDPSVSRRHARIDFWDGQYTIRDLNSTNGTLVNGKRISFGLLKSGDFITFGTTVCTFKVE